MDSVAIRLGELTTLRLGGPAAELVTASSEDELIGAVAERDEAGAPVLVLGGGSNLVISDDGFAGRVVRIATTGERVVDRDPDGSEVRIEVAAGEDWDAFVARVVAAGYGGLECLSGIPGQVGATPIQNVGAYGWEISEFLRWVRLYDRRSGRTLTVAPDDLGLTYRSSRLKGTDDAIVLSVCFGLHPDGASQPIRYQELARALGVAIGTRLPCAEVRAAVLELRRSKGMVLDPADHDTWSAGSFFTNPVVSAQQLRELRERIDAVVGPEASVPQYPAESGVKLSAAWLIERAGFAKGHAGPGGRVSLSGKHTLALTNRGAASTEDLLALAREVRDGVDERFGVTLRPEPLLVNCSL
ncbi:UDP-N-acetylmuramate dehydrogenase [Haloechinothrix sp. LS1_15]|uniref:UDP-N-acetylmuramate dehydrogenase n=1 Tax=Haloechinothrix sp. LS1_15 TaxID=2652248 RepID=UPI00294800FB|nr:UDP-N-acetylmuramate dehydrogenase [Haloechinothrix sp. LS1_15]MDV6012610.1 UDP-N-acetylmuramate dehydrogenase [Haloechinothrix sp. LS1_15]